MEESRRGKDRIKIEGLHNLAFKVQIPGGESFIDCPLSNVSSKGLAFFLDNADADFKVDSTINGELTIDGQVFLVVLNVRHITDHSVGCFIENMEGELHQALETYFINETSAKDMTSIHSNWTQVETNTRITHLASKNSACEIMFEVSKTDFVKIKIIVVGNVIEWNEGNLSYGFTIGESKDDKELVVVKVPSLPEEIINHALRFVSHISQISDQQKEKICSYLQPDLSTN